MNTYAIILIVAVLLLLLGAHLTIMVKRYTKVGPNQVLIISGRKRQLPDGSTVGFRIVKSGGTVVFPILEKADVLPLEVLTLEMPDTKALVAQGSIVDINAVAQIKIKNDESSIASAAEHFLSKSELEIKSVLRSVLEKHLRQALSVLSLDEINHFAGAAAAKVQTAASPDLTAMGLGLISFNIRKVSG
jgi:flotillin